MNCLLIRRLAMLLLLLPLAGWVIWKGLQAEEKVALPEWPLLVPTMAALFAMMLVLTMLASWRNDPDFAEP